MSILENLLEALGKHTAALDANTKALAGAGAAAPASTGKGAAAGGAKGKATTDKTAAPKYSADEVKAAAVKLKDSLGLPAAKEVIKDFGKADELKGIKPENYDAFVEEAERRIKEQEEGGSASDDL